ncbi:MAG TPA: Stk1 family PASTA domain-containing Ser/Thr kinase [Clostridia bacterium]|nr:Stk1 family PASTA domain-containing Ser/Thr kinase [Clostridia bacterium]
MSSKLLKGRYEILEKIGSGGMAVVYKARDILLHRYVTVKVLRPEYTADENFVRRFQSEAQAVASLSHPNIVSIHDVGKEKDTYFLVMEYIDGDNLKTIIEKEGPIEPVKAVGICRQVCRALEHAHENKIVHQDVKPHNILITKSGRVKLTDFGIARKASAITYTNTKTIMGSIHYLSPEQAKGYLAGPESDLYSLGIVLYEMLTGVVPFTADNAVGVAVKHIKEKPKGPSVISPRVPESLEQIVLHALRKDKLTRYRTAGEMLSDFNKFLSGDDIRYSDDYSTNDETKVVPIISEADKEGSTKTIDRKKIIQYSLIALVLVSVALIAGFYLMKNYVNVPEVSVPSVLGMQLEEAQELLEDEGLKVEVIEEFNTEAPEGEVIKQDIVDIKVKANRIITLTVSKGQDLKTVPDVTRYKPEDAQTMIEGADLAPGEVREEYNNDVPKGFVFRTNPAAGAEVGQGTRVAIYVSAGSEPENYAMPDLTGMNTEKAGLIVRTLGLKISEDIQFVPSDKYLAGQIVDQNPRKNTEVKEGMSVTLTVSNGPGPSARQADVTVPIEDDDKDHEVLITVEDISGTSEAYTGIHSPGETLVERVTFYGEATVRVYIDNKLKKEYPL